MSTVKIEESWKAALASEFTQPYWNDLTQYVKTAYQSTSIYPPAGQIFRAFDLCPLSSVKVVIVGQDPYHGSGQATGLSFAVSEGVSIPPSLQNIFKEIALDTGVQPEHSGDLTRWAQQGVLLLNSVLTVQAGQPASHKDKGWEKFTDAVIAAVTAKRKNVAYLLWGKYAQQKGAQIDREQNLVLTSTHPSPYSADKFFGNHHFSTCNFYLEQHGIPPIDWR